MLVDVLESSSAPDAGGGSVVYSPNVKELSSMASRCTSGIALAQDISGDEKASLIKDRERYSRRVEMR